MLEVVNYEDGGKTNVFQEGARFAEVHTEITLKTLAKAGGLLFTNLFGGQSFGPKIRTWDSCCARFLAAARNVSRCNS
jgi:hypothetical protein